LPFQAAAKPRNTDRIYLPFFKFRSKLNYLDRGHIRRDGRRSFLIIQRLGTMAGATAEELATATGWQRHTVHGALSRLRARGFAMRREVEGDRKAYHLARLAG